MLEKPCMQHPMLLLQVNLQVKAQVYQTCGVCPSLYLSTAWAFWLWPPPPPPQSHCSANAGRGLFLFVYLSFSPPLTYVVIQGRQPPSHPTHPQQEVLCTRSLGSPQFFMLMPKLHIFSLATLHMSNLWISVVCTG